MATTSEVKAAVMSGLLLLSGPLAWGQQIFSAVTAYSDLGAESPYSNEIALTPEQISEGVTVAWDAPEDNGVPIAGYRVYFGTASGSYSQFKDAGLNLEFVVDLSPAAPGKFRVKIIPETGLNLRDDWEPIAGWEPIEGWVPQTYADPERYFRLRFERVATNTQP
jgi:hypothetical protein